MERIKLFEIPIYAMEQNEFDKKWDKEIRKYNIHSEEEYKEIKNVFFPMTVWQYNQIIGYIVISLVKYDYGSDIDFEWYQCKRERFIFNSKRKNYIENFSLLGYHSFIEKDYDNERIKLEIRELLDDLLEDECLKNRYIDLSMFEIQLKYLDIKGIINN